MAIALLSTIGAFAKKLLGNIAKGFLKSSGLGSLLAGGLAQRAVNSSLTGKEREQNDYNAQQAELQRQFARQEREESQAFNASQAQQQMAFQERMASTQYQRSVADMQAAGINPALAMSNGIAGASASGAMASSSPANGSAASGSSQLMGLSELLQFMQVKAQIEKTKAETANLRVQSEGQDLQNKIAAKWGDLTAQASYEEINSRIESLEESANLSRYERQVLGPARKAALVAEERHLNAESFYEEWRKEFYDTHGYWPEPSAEKSLLRLFERIYDFGEEQGEKARDRYARSVEERLHPGGGSR